MLFLPTSTGKTINPLTVAQGVFLMVQTASDNKLGETMELGFGACQKIAMLGLATGLLSAPVTSTGQEVDPRIILEEYCSSCHTPNAGGGLQAITPLRMVVNSRRSEEGRGSFVCFALGFSSASLEC